MIKCVVVVGCCNYRWLLLMSERSSVLGGNAGCGIGAAVEMACNRHGGRGALGTGGL